MFYEDENGDYIDRDSHGLESFIPELPAWVWDNEDHPCSTAPLGEGIECPFCGFIGPASAIRHLAYALGMLNEFGNFVETDQPITDEELEKI